MPPKGRKSVSPWNQCEVCNVLISQKDLALHLEYSCPPSADSWIHGYIKDTVLFGVLEDAVREDAFNKIPKHEQDNLVLLSKSALQLCDIAIGDPVIVTLCGVSTIKRAWPTVDRSLVSVLMRKKAIELHWKSAKNHHVKVRRLTMVPLPAEEVLIDTREKSQFTSEFITILHAKYQGRILGIGDRLLMQYYGKDVILTVQQIIPFQVHRDKITLFSKSLERISLEETAEGKNEFFKVEGETRWKVIANEQPEMETSPHTKLANIGGLQNVILEVYEIMQLALGNVLITEGMQVIRGILLFGVSGIGKTLLAEALAAESKAFLITVRGAEIYSKYLGETETKLRQLFQKAKVRAPSVLLLDEIDALCPKRDQDSSGGSEQDRRVISTLLTLMDELHSKKGSSSAVFVLATTSKPDAIDPSLRRPGRFDREIEVPVPTPEARLDILKKLLANTTHALTDKQLQGMAYAAHGFVGADLASLCSLAANQALKRTSSSFSRVTIKSEDFSWALKQVKPSAMREVLIEITDVKWNDIGGQHDLKLKLQQAVEWPLKHPEAFTRLGISPPRGVLLYGPPGCSKTMIAKALATESKLNFISIKGPELFSKWVGESERAVREIFRRARQVAPAIVFFDELDALGGERSSKSGSGGISVQERVLAQLLTELDGVEPLGNVTVVGATNRPDRIDKALLRPGRLDRVLYVPLPNTQARKEILEIQLRKMPISADVNIEELVEKTEDYSGAEVLAVCHEAALSALEEDITIATVCHCHFLKGLELIKPRTPISLLRLYDEYQKAN